MADNASDQIDADRLSRAANIVEARADIHRAEVEAAVKRAIEACADKCAERALYIEDCVKWGGSKTYVTSLKGGIIELANVGQSIRAIASDPASLAAIVKGPGE
jgi:hypothetical protein